MIRIEQLIDISLQFYGSQFYDLCNDALFSTRFVPIEMEQEKQ